MLCGLAVGFQRAPRPRKVQKTAEFSISDAPVHTRVRLTRAASHSEALVMPEKRKCFAGLLSASNGLLDREKRKKQQFFADCSSTCARFALQIAQEA